MKEQPSQWLPSVISEEVAEGALERERSVIESGETKCYFLPSIQKEDETAKPEILIGARDMGPTQALLPVAKALIERGYPLSFLVDQPAEKYLLQEMPGLQEISLQSPLAAIPERQPGLILSCISGTGGPGIEFYGAMTGEGYGDGEVTHVPTVWIEDFWGVAEQEIALNARITPDVVCTFDEASRDMDIKRLKDSGQDVSPDRFVVTGSPAFDKLAQEADRDAITKKVRESLQIADDEILIASIGGRPPKDLENLKLFIESISQANLQDKKVKMTARIHPSVYGAGDLSKYRAEYEKLFAQSGQVEFIETMGKFSTDEVAMAADIITSSYGTEGIKAVYRGKISLFMLLPGLGADDLKAAVGMETLPVIESGASIGVFKPEDMKAAIERAFDPEALMRIKEAQKQHHHLDGRNTERVVAVIETALATNSNKLITYE